MDSAIEMGTLPPIKRARVIEEGDEEEEEEEDVEKEVEEEVEEEEEDVSILIFENLIFIICFIFLNRHYFWEFLKKFHVLKCILPHHCTCK